jgi:hypothetical protein
VGFLLAIAYAWWCGLAGRRGRLLRVAVTALIGEGVLVVAMRGDVRLTDCKNVWAIPCRCSS